jgi:DNA-binding protein H-NS
MTTKTYKQLLAEREALEVQIQAVRNAERGAVIEQIQALMEDWEIHVGELVKKRVRVSKGPGVAPKYRDPDSGATWSGRGKPPLWIAGKDRAAFAI